MNEMMVMGAGPMMSSVEIAELTGKEHKNVLADIRKMLVEIQSAEKSADYQDSMGRAQPCLMLDKDESLCLVAGYSAVLRMRIIRRWQELEAQQGPKVPRTYAEALLEAGRLAMELDQAQATIAIQAPKAEFADRVAGADKGTLIGNFAKTVGLWPKQIFAVLRELRILMSGGNRHNLPFQEYLDRGYFTVAEKPYEVHGETRLGFQPLITGKGQQWLTKRLIDSGHLKGMAA
ncbi:phage regulatory protein/antirepressor Ant [Aeromonas hydrophila]|uniref:phage antirepressor KilAC domain-containing protein n=1 Tax=Aeromonas hydrophila TaxID=644 RepID=UPI001B39E8F7|nr:phage regulatory protein/antirepressor Ant [Aeromonas hydrophila]MBQ4675557.1 DNA-binding protein [Aeromonas hydrophila]MBW3814684.1 DNA-binding protein [Aeromonas hydrophila]MCF7680617.1 phage regulatory protein/antirepressor Ant [Aeromonas hydrophila]MCF7693525.1 phage regulatory protein/antirepressor Ant [Aeromonas hydrophila]MCF7774396.1 phage regulatory protein/antirepressor Ant [Aeromonas hydrophila]